MRMKKWESEEDLKREMEGQVLSEVGEAE